MVALRLQILLLALLLLFPVAAQARLTLGWVPGAAILGREDQAQRLAAHLEARLAEPVELRYFSNEAQLHEWLHRYRMVDLATLSEDYYQQLPTGQLLPVASLSFNSASAQLVLHQGLRSEQQLQLRTLLAELSNDPAGSELLAGLGNLGLSPPQGSPLISVPTGAPVPALPVVAEPGRGDATVPQLSATAVQPSSSGAAKTPPPLELIDVPPVLPGDATLTNAHDYLSRNVEVLARKIDTFFGTERAFEESSGTYIQARGSLIYQKHGDVDFDGNIKAKLDLPNLKKKLSLVIESDTDDNLDPKGQITTGTAKVTDTFDSKKASASLQYVLREERFWDVRLQPGIKLHWPPETFLRLRMRRIQPISENWLSRVTLTPGWYDPRGWEVRLRHDFDRDAGQGSLFRIASEATWLVKEDRNVGLVQSFAYAHPLTRRAQMAYEAGVTFETDPTFWDTSYFSSIRYRRNIHRGWVFLELKPQVLFERDRDFKPDPSFALTLEIVFGARSMAVRPAGPPK